MYNPQNIHTNWISTVDAPFNDLEVFKHSLDPLPEEPVHGLLRSLSNRNCFQNVPTIPFRNDLISLSENLPISESNGYKLISNGDFKLLPNQHEAIIARFGQLAIKKAASRIGFNKHESGKLFGGTPQFFPEFLSFAGLHFRVDSLGDGNILVAIDPTSRWVQTVDQWIGLMLARGFSINEVHEQLVSFPVLYPSYRKWRWVHGNIAEILPVSSKGYLLENKQTLFQFWQGNRQKAFLNNWCIDSKPEVTVAEIPIGDIRRSYPIDILRTLIDISLLQVDKGRIHSIKERVQKTKSLINSMFKSPIDLGSVEVNFKPILLSSRLLAKFNYSFDFIHPPSLEFGNDLIWPLKYAGDVRVGFQKGGPYSGSKRIGVHYILPPEIIERSDYPESWKTFHSELNLGAKYYKLGSFIPRSVHKLKSNNPLAYLNIAKSIKFTTKKPGNEVVIVILPQNFNSRCYRMAKKGLGNAGICSKGIRLGTFNLLSSKRPSKAQTSARGIIALSLYARTIVPGEAGMLLHPSARGLKSDTRPLTLSVDISRDLLRHEEVAADMVTMDNRGLLLDMGGTVNFKEGIILKEIIQDWVVERTSQACGIMDDLDLPQPNSIIQAYDGALKGSQREEMLEGLKLAAEELISEGLFPKETTQDILEITKKIPDRLYDIYDRKLPEGIVVISPVSTIFLLASRPYFGTPQPLRLHRSSNGNGSAFSDSLSVAQFVHDMRYLDPVSPYVQPKLPIFGHTVHKKSNAARYGKVPYITY